MSIQKDLSDLLRAEVITQETADKIKHYYKNKSSSSTNRLFLIFGVLGAILIGLGLILIIAHNWDELSRTTKTFFAFLPLVTAQLLCIYTLLKKADNIAWKESSSTFLFFSVGASISLVSQIYNLPGDLRSFMLCWMLLVLPLIYIMNSAVTSLLYIVGITYYATLSAYFSWPSDTAYPYWILFFALIPYYYNLFRKKPGSNAAIFHNWFVPLSLTICLGILSRSEEQLMYIAYVNLFSIFYFLGGSETFLNQKTRNNGYKILGDLGLIVILLQLSFHNFWERIYEHHYWFAIIVRAPEFYAVIVSTLLAAFLLFRKIKHTKVSGLKPLEISFVLFILVFLFGMLSTSAVVIINLMVFGIGLFTIRQGAKQNHLGILNFGLLVITALVICRFFDSDLSFVIRGLLFIGVGAGFFVANYLTIKKRKLYE